MTKPLEIHPDPAAIRDWVLYGPRDPQIAILVERLANERQMPLEDIEALMIETLAALLPNDGG